MIEDRLTQSERRRLECVAQAIAFHTYKSEADPEKIIETARKFEGYIGDESFPIPHSGGKAEYKNPDNSLTAVLEVPEGYKPPAMIKVPTFPPGSGYDEFYLEDNDG